MPDQVADPVDFQEDYQYALHKRAEPTGQWFLEDQVINNWITIFEDKTENAIV